MFPMLTTSVQMSSLLGDLKDSCNRTGFTKQIPFTMPRNRSTEYRQKFFQFTTACIYILLQTNQDQHKRNMHYKNTTDKSNVFWSTYKSQIKITAITMAQINGLD